MPEQMFQLLECVDFLLLFTVAGVTFLSTEGDTSDKHLLHWGRELWKRFVRGARTALPLIMIAVFVECGIWLESQVLAKALYGSCELMESVCTPFGRQAWEKIISCFLFALAITMFPSTAIHNKE